TDNDAVNTAPVANADSKSTTLNTAVTIDVTANDTDSDGIDKTTVDLDPATPCIQTSFTSAHGIWSVNASGIVTYTPTTGYVGTDSINYSVKDNLGLVSSNTATITITVVLIAPTSATANRNNICSGDTG